MYVLSMFVPLDSSGFLIPIGEGEVSLKLARQGHSGFGKNLIQNKTKQNQNKTKTIVLPNFGLP